MYEARHRPGDRLLFFRRAVLAALIAGPVIAPRAAEAQLTIQHDFEDGSLQGWVPRGPVTLSNTTEAANGGARSLKTTGRTAAFNGPSLNLLGQLQPDVAYQLRVAVRLVAGQPASQVVVTMQRTPAGLPDVFERIAASAEAGVTDAGWTTLVGSYRFTGDVSGLILYVESGNATLEYYIDDFRLAEVVPDQTGFACDFETARNSGLYCFTALDTTDRNWGGRGSAAVANTTEDAHGGTRSLKTTGRTAVWNGPALNILSKMTPGFRYRVTVWAKLVAGEAPTRLRVSVEHRRGGAAAFNTVVPNTPVTADQWVRLSSLFVMPPSDGDQLSLYVEAETSPTVAFYIDDVELTFLPPPPIQTDLPRLKEVLADDFVIGAAVEPAEIASARHAQLAIHHFGSLTAGNAMKFGPIHPAEATYNFTGADTIADFARAQGMTMHGHTLVWHSQNPDWLFRDAAGVDLTPSPESKALMLQRLEDHVRTVVPRYDDVVSAWDVVNEVIDASQPDGLRRTRWYELTGTDYIDRAFQVAREVAGPGVKLCINDFNTDEVPKRQALLNVVQGMLARGVPVDCVGHQMHINIEFPSVAAIGQTIETFAALGLENRVTEMDMSVYTNGTDVLTEIPEETLVRQGYRYRDIFREYRRLKDSIAAVTTWGLADDNTWLKTFPITRLNLPLLFDEDLQAKHAYWGVVDPLQLPVVNQRLNVVEGAARVDGREDTIWDSTGATAVTGEGAFSASFKALWNEDYLFVLVDVQDPTRSRRDKVELFVDENNAKGTSYDDDDAHYTADRSGRCERRRRGSWRRHPHQGGLRFQVKEQRGGYRVELAIPIDRELALGAEVGFDLRITDGTSNTIFGWNDFTLEQAENPSKFGTLVLVTGNRFTEAAFGTPVVDAVEDAVWARAREFTTDVFVLGTSGSTARVKALWDNGRIYVYAKVTDSLLSKASPNAFEQDSVEIFVDQNNAKTTSYQADDGQYRVNFENTQSFGGAATAARLTSATRIVPGGYEVEAAITLTDVTPASGLLIGFDFQVNNDELGDGVRSSVKIWNDPSGQSFRNTSRLGVLRLVRRPHHSH
jgi:endo-1,4-beta-xylanase